MEHFLFIFILIPLFGFFLNFIIPAKNEKILSQSSFLTMGAQFLAVFIFNFYWLYEGSPSLYTRELSIYKSDVYELFFDFSYDKATAIYLMVGAFLAFLITTYSRSYLHREKGYKRFFTTIMFFFLGYNTIVLSGNPTTIFIGWEISGISSFLLIAYYRNRYIPVKNAVKIFSVYRIGDGAILLALWASHHLWHKNIVLSDFENKSAVLEIINNHYGLAIFFSLLIFIAASIKSAQLPFSSWLPRAMEGPTPSSAIFYGSLSSHIGVLLLIRTYGFWENILPIKLLIIFSGILTYIITSITARVQPSIKGQIAYSSVAQIGIMFVEVALGWHTLALIHFAGNAFLRSYQLLLSPSVVTYLIRDQFYNFKPSKSYIGKTIWEKVKNSIYVLSLREWYMDEIIHHSIWNFLKRIGLKLHIVPVKAAIIVFFAAMGAFSFFFFNKDVFGKMALQYFPTLMATMGLMFSLWAFTERKNIYWSWLLIGFNHFLNAMTVELIANVSNVHTGIYLSGVISSLFVGYLALKRLHKFEKDIDLSGYQGHCYEHPKIEAVFLLAALGLFGFPISSTFLGIELMYGYINAGQILILSIISLSILVNSLAVIRMYARIFMGPHIKTYHESARKSS